MPSFSYIARTKSGEKVEGTVEATDRRAALAYIERLGQIPVSVEEGKTKKTSGKSGFKWSTFFKRSKHQKLSARELLIFTTELGDLLSSGMKLGNALNTLSH
ncbi:MAG: hypothetical protein GX811_09365, partial [Lentisphaerae bacterium]|nr:hypothetical protein [Lentisphaerota bacterium]